MKLIKKKYNDITNAISLYFFNKAKPNKKKEIRRFTFFRWEHSLTIIRRLLREDTDSISVIFGMGVTH